MNDQSAKVNAWVYEENKRKACIPDEYWRYHLSDYDFSKSGGGEDPLKKRGLAMVVTYINNLEENFRKGRGFYIRGERNKRQGISLLGTFVLKAALEQMKTCYYIEFSSLLQKITNRYREENQEVIDFCYDVEFLLLDSIESSKSQKDTRIHDCFSDIIAHRRQKKLPIVFCSYQSYHSLADSYCQTLLNYVNEYSNEIDLSNPNTERYNLIEVIQRLQDYNLKNRPKEIPIEKIVKIIVEG